MFQTEGVYKAAALENMSKLDECFFFFFFALKHLNVNVCLVKFIVTLVIKFSENIYVGKAIKKTTVLQS